MQRYKTILTTGNRVGQAVAAVGVFGVITLAGACAASRDEVHASLRCVGACELRVDKTELEIEAEDDL